MQKLLLMVIFELIFGSSFMFFSHLFSWLVTLWNYSVAYLSKYLEIEIFIFTGKVTKAKYNGHGLHILISKSLEAQPFSFSYVMGVFGSFQSSWYCFDLDAMFVRVAGFRLAVEGTVEYFSQTLNLLGFKFSR